MKFCVDRRFQLLYHWNDREQAWQWGVTDSETDSVHCGLSVSQLDLMAEAVQKMKEWRRLK
jgi:hypothetical protein